MERLTKNINGVICYVGEHKQNDEDVPAEMNASARCTRRFNKPVCL